MFAKKGGQDRMESMDTVVGKDCEVKGTVSSMSGMRVDGRVEGEISCRGDLIVGESAVVTANIRARNVTIAGEVKGNVETDGKLELTPSGKLTGDIKVGSLVVAAGALFRGTSEMKKEGQGAPSSKTN